MAYAGCHMSVLEYEIRVDGRLPRDVLEGMEHATVTTHPVETILRGTVADRAELHELINRLQGLGLELTEIRRLAP